MKLWMHVADRLGRCAPRSRAALVGCSLALCVSGAWAQGPEVALDATELVADIRQTRSVAEGVEEGMQLALGKLAEHTERLSAAGCQVGNEQENCRSMRGQMRDDYLVLLDGIESRLPVLRESVEQVVGNLEARMTQGGEASTEAMQEEIVGERSRSGAARRPALAGVSGSRLSESLGKLQQLVSSAASGQVSLRAIQSDLYLDMRESLDVIGHLQADIDRTRIQAELRLGDMQVSSEQLDTTADVRRQLFGETDRAVPDGAVLPPPDEADYVSPIEM